jgi:hypothetical protein
VSAVRAFGMEDWSIEKRKKKNQVQLISQENHIKKHLVRIVFSFPFAWDRGK